MKVAIDGTLPMTPASGSFRYLTELVRALEGLAQPTSWASAIAARTLGVSGVAA